MGDLFTVVPNSVKQDENHPRINLNITTCAQFKPSLQGFFVNIPEHVECLV